MRVIQAKELVRRLKKLRDVDYTNEWVMVIVTIGTEEVDNFKELIRVVFYLSSACNVENRITMPWSAQSTF